MAITYTPRFGLPQWSAGTDAVSRAQFNNAFNSIETQAAKDSQGTLASRPAFGQAGRYYFATDTSVLYRDTGTAWTVVGSNTINSLVRPAAANNVALTVQALASQTSNLFETKDSSNAVLASISSWGSFRAGGVYISGNGGYWQASQIDGASLSVTAVDDWNPVQVIKMADGHSGLIFNVENYSGYSIFNIHSNGAVNGRAFHATTDVAGDATPPFAIVGGGGGVLPFSVAADGTLSARNFRVGTTEYRPAWTTDGDVYVDTTTESLWVASDGYWKQPYSQLLMGDTEYKSQGIENLSSLFTPYIMKFGGDLIVRTGGTDDHKFMVEAGGAITFGQYGTGTGYTTGSAANAHLDAGGVLMKSTSSRRYKEAIEDAPLMRSVLDIQPRTWLPKNVNQGSERLFGAIAEELHDLGLSHLVSYDAEGRPDAIQYDRVAIALIPFVKNLTERVENLEMALGITG